MILTLWSFNSWGGRELQVEYIQLSEVFYLFLFDCNRIKMVGLQHHQHQNCCIKLLKNAMTRETKNLEAVRFSTNMARLGS